MRLPHRPKRAPRRIPLWAWHYDAWLRGGCEGPRPAHAPKRLPAWFGPWRRWRIRIAKLRGTHAWKQHLKHNKVAAANKAARARIVKHARWGAEHTGQMAYSETAERGHWLAAKNPNMLPQATDCSGFVTQCYYAAGLPDPNGLAYRYLGYTGTELSNAAKVGTVTEDVSKALPGDIIVIGPGTGEHEVLCVTAGADPMVATHGGPGVQIQRLSVDGREPKRVCKTLP